MKKIALFFGLISTIIFTFSCKKENINNDDISKEPVIEWQKSFGGSDNDVAKSIKQTNDGGFIVVGYTESIDYDITENFGVWDYWIIKLDQSGEIEWKKTLGGSWKDDPFSIQQTNDGGYIIAGSSNSNDGHVTGFHNTNGSSDYWIVKLGVSGNIDWTKCYGGSSHDEATSIQQTSDGGYIVCGYTNSDDGNVTTHIQLADWWIVKIDVVGNIEWEKTYGDFDSDIPYSIVQIENGNYIIAGYTHTNYNEDNYWIIKIDSIGNLLFEKSLGGSDRDIARSINQTSDGGFIICGYSNSNDGNVSNPDKEYIYWVVKLNVSGTMEWEKSYGGYDWERANSIRQTIDGGYIIAGQSSSNNGDVSMNNGSSDFWIVKLDNTGNMKWEKSLGGSNFDEAYSIEQTTDGGYIIAGYSESSDGDLSTNYGEYDFWIVKLNVIK
ncbi:MAG: hypothetical protein KAT68_04430 [Bacteroidales bacterium]|nr:hypothetical protein [Bacteroidales bacterium]